jgi:hypothetical protein
MLLLSLRSLSKSVFTGVLDVVAELGILKYRGTRAGRLTKFRAFSRHPSAITAASIQPAVSDYTSQIPSLHRTHHLPPPTVNTVRARILRPVPRAPASAAIKVGVYNACSIGNKYTVVSKWISDNDLALAAVVETWHDSGDSPALIACTPNTHRNLECARPRPVAKCNAAPDTGPNHGGVALFFSKAIIARKLVLPVYKTFEVLATYLQGSLVTAVVLTIYRPGSTTATSQFFDEFSDLLEKTILTASPLFILGDLNIHLDDISLPHTKQLNEILTAHGLVQHVTQPTHSDGHLLDVFISRFEAAVPSITVEPPLSDHSRIIAEVNLRLPSNSEATRRTSRNWRAFDVYRFADDLDRSQLVSDPPPDVTQLFTCYDDTLRSLLDKHAPFVVKKIRARPTAPWYDASCQAVKVETRRLEKAYRASKTPANYDAWQMQFHRQRICFQQRFKDFWSQSIDSSASDIKALWSKISILLKPQQIMMTSSHTPDNFADFFDSKIDTIRSNTRNAPAPQIVARHVAKMTDFDQVTDDEMLKLLRRSPAKHCPLDPVPTWLIKRLADRFAPVFAQMCNASLDSGVVPNAHKQAIVRPTLKKPSLDPSDLASYRPISNLTFLSKMVERAVATRFTQHADRHNLLPVRQSAYRAHYSTETAVVSVHNDLVCAIDDGFVSALVLLDLSAAFDTVDHGTLIDVLKQRFGLDGTVLSWFCSYLADRSQTYIVGNKRSLQRNVVCGVPQGSVLGPKQFIAYTEEVAAKLARPGVNEQLFADDKQANTRVRVNNITAATDLLAACVGDVADCCASRRLQLNPTKSEIAWFGSHANLSRIANDDACSLMIGADTIKPSDVVRDLGVLLDSELTMKQHVGKVASVCYFHLRRLRQVRRMLGPDVTKTLVSAFVFSRLDYCNAVLAGLPKSTTNTLQRVQNAAARLVLDLGPRDGVTSAMRQLHWLPVRYRVKYKLCVLMHAVVIHQSPAYITDVVTATADIAARASLRSATSLAYDVPRTRTEFGKRAFSVAGPKQWNKLPVSLRSVADTAKFKAELKTVLFRRAYKQF